jgi:hypothetical protein
MDTVTDEQRRVLLQRLDALDPVILNVIMKSKQFIDILMKMLNINPKEWGTVRYPKKYAYIPDIPMYDTFRFLQVLTPMLEYDWLKLTLRSEQNSIKIIIVFMTFIYCHLYPLLKGTLTPETLALDVYSTFKFSSVLVTMFRQLVNHYNSAVEAYFVYTLKYDLSSYPTKNTFSIYIFRSLNVLIQDTHALIQENLDPYLDIKRDNALWPVRRPITEVIPTDAYVLFTISDLMTKSYENYDPTFIQLSDTSSIINKPIEGAYDYFSGVELEENQSYVNCTNSPPHYYDAALYSEWCLKKGFTQVDNKKIYACMLCSVCNRPMDPQIYRNG